MRRLVVLFLALGAMTGEGFAQPVSGILAARETEALTYEDKLAARNAEQEALNRDQPVESFEWQGPDGATGFIIVGGEYPYHDALGRCRAFIHIVRHKNDGGVNPTFRGKVCRGWDGAWSVQQ